jgi:hypothetical protein
VLSEICKALVEEAIGARKSTDNVSVALVRVDDSPPPGGPKTYVFSTSEAPPVAGPVTSTTSFLLPKDAAVTSPPCNGFVVHTGLTPQPSLDRGSSGESVDDVDGLLKELNSIDDDLGFAPADTTGARVARPPQGAPRHAPQAPAQGQGGRKDDIGGDAELMDFLMDDSNFGEG